MCKWTWQFSLQSCHRENSSIGKLRVWEIDRKGKNSQNASKMRSKWVLFYWEKRNVPKCVRNAPKMRLKNARNLSGFKKALLQNPREMIRGRIFSEMIRISARKSELQAESRSYGRKIGDTAGQTPRIRTESPRKGPRMGFGCFYRKPP